MRDIDDQTGAMPTAAEKEAIKKARQQAARAREQRRRECEAAAIRVQCSVRRFLARRRVQKRRHYLISSGKMAKVIMSQVRVHALESYTCADNTPRPPHMQLSLTPAACSCTPLLVLLFDVQRLRAWQEDRRLARTAGYSAMFLHPRAAARERKRWHEWKQSYRQTGHRVSVQSVPDFFLASLRAPLVDKAFHNKASRDEDTNSDSLSAASTIEAVPTASTPEKMWLKVQPLAPADAPPLDGGNWTHRTQESDDVGLPIDDGGE